MLHVAKRKDVKAVR